METARYERNNGCVIICDNAYAENTPEQNEAARRLVQRTAWEIMQDAKSAQSVGEIL